MPSQFASLTLVSTSVSKTVLGWRQPNIVGGCAILNYVVEKDDGNLGDFAPFTGSELTASTFQLEITGLMYSLEYRFRVVATNLVGSQESNIVKATIADVPSTPVTAPSFDAAETNATQIRVTMAKVTLDNGAPITSYHL